MANQEVTLTVYNAFDRNANLRTSSEFFPFVVVFTVEPSTLVSWVNVTENGTVTYSGPPRSVNGVSNCINLSGVPDADGGTPAGVAFEVSSGMYNETMISVQTTNVLVWTRGALTLQDGAVVMHQGTTDSLAPTRETDPEDPTQQSPDGYYALLSLRTNAATTTALDTRAVTLYKPSCAWPQHYYSAVLAQIGTALAEVEQARLDGDMSATLYFVEIGVGWGYLNAAIRAAFSGRNALAYVGVDPYDATSFGDSFSQEVPAVLPSHPLTGEPRSAQDSFDALFAVAAAQCSRFTSDFSENDLLRDKARSEGELGAQLLVLRTLCATNKTIVFIDGAHDAASLQHDLAYAWSLLAVPGGFLLIDDVGSTARPSPYPDVAATLQTWQASTPQSALSTVAATDGYELAKVERTA